MVPFHAWFMIMIPGAVLGRVGETTGRSIVAALYPTPVPRLRHLLPVLPFSLLSALIVLSNIGGVVGFWTVLVCFIVPGVLGLASRLIALVPDVVVEHLGTDSNYLILTEPRLAEKADRSDSSEETLQCRLALRASVAYDHMLDELFSAMPGEMPSMFVNSFPP
jgi:hypothetical protein